MRFLKSHIELAISAVTLIGFVVGFSIYVSDIKAQARTNKEQIEELKIADKKHNEEYQNIRDKINETHTTVKNIEKYLIEKR